MYKSFKAKNFRRFRDLNVSNLERVNLIAGMNNVGKTCLLEALFVHCGGYNPELVLRINAFRGIELVKVEFGRWTKTPWDYLFYEFETSKIIELTGEDQEKKVRRIQLKLLRQPDELKEVVQLVRQASDSSGYVFPHSWTAHVLELEYQEERWNNRHYMIFDQQGLRIVPAPPPPPFPAFFLAARTRTPLAEDIERFGNLEAEGRQEVVLQSLQILEPRLRRITTAVTGGMPMLYGDVGEKRLMPLPLMGEGMARLASLVLAIGNAPDGVVLVDEVENGLHHSLLPKVWQAVAEAARRFNVQVFATTHSLECITAAHRAFSESESYDFRLHRLDCVEDTIRVVTYDRETLEAAIETGLEVR